MTPQGQAGGMFGIGALGSLMGGFGEYESGQLQRKAYDYNADVAAAAIEQKYAERIGKQASAYAASGVDIASGSPLLIMAATAARGAQQEKQTTDVMRYEGKMAAWGGTMSGIGTFLRGMTQSFAAYKGATMPTPSPTATDSDGDF